MSFILSRLIRGQCRRFIRKCQPIRHGHKGAYEGEGKTTVTILNRDTEYGLMVDAISPVGFRLNIGLFVLGPMIIFPRTIIGWNIGSPSEIHEDSLTLFKVLAPRPDFLILGINDNYPRDTPFIMNFQKTMKNLNILFEVLPVDKACSTFNFLAAENRYVVGAFLPPKNIGYASTKKLEEGSAERILREL